MEVSDEELRMIVSGCRSCGKTAKMRKSMFDIKGKIAIVSRNEVRYSEWADAEEIK